MTEPENVLWMSVVVQAVQDLSGPDLVAKSARAWFASSDKSIGSLTWVCHHLSLDPDAVREHVLRRPISELRALTRNRSRAAVEAACFRTAAPKTHLYRFKRAVGGPSKSRIGSSRL